MTDHILPPYCPRRYSNIVKHKAKNYDDLQRMAFDISKAMKKDTGKETGLSPLLLRGRTQPRGGSRSARDPERSGRSEEGARQPRLPRVDENASVWYKREQVIKYGGNPKMCRKARCWTMLEHEQNLDRDKILEALTGTL